MKTLTFTSFETLGLFGLFVRDVAGDEVALMGSGDFDEEISISMES